MECRAPTPSRPILLVGLPGAGKSTLAPLLAAALGLTSHDSDALIAAASGQSIAEMFRDGEATFRAEERRCLLTLLDAGPAVIAAGGGAWLDAEIRTAAATATAIWLDADLPTLAARLGDAAGRPLLAGSVRSSLRALKAARDPFYALAPLRIDAGPPPAMVVATIVAALAEPVR